MTEVQTKPPLNGEVEESAVKQPSSLLDELRAKRKALSAERHTDIPIPGYDEKLVVRYKPLEWDALRRINEKAEKAGPRQVLIAATDTLVAACSEVLIRREDELVPLQVAAPTFGDEPVGYDSRLAEALSIDAEKARQVVWGVFQNELALVTHYGQLMEWMSDSNSEDDRDFDPSSWAMLQ